MIAQYQLYIWRAHHPSKHGGAAVPIAVNHVAQHKKLVVIAEASPFQQAAELIKLAMEIGGYIHHPSHPFQW